MDARTIDAYLARAAASATVSELHATVRTLRHAHPADPDADRVERACWERALGLLRATRPRRGAPGAVPASPAARRIDWKEQAARMAPNMEPNMEPGMEPV